MNEQPSNVKVPQRINNYQHEGRRWVGILLLVIGALLLARASGADLPAWLFSWPMIPIAFGLLSGIRHKFRGIGWLIPILVGLVFLVDKISPELKLKPYIWPIALIAFGLLFLFRPRKNHFECWNEGNNLPPAGQPIGDNEKTQWQNAMSDGSDVIDATAILGGVKKNVLSKNFRGGDITTFMGGAEINLTQADCNGRVIIDCFNMFGGTKLIVPSDWDVQSGLITIFGGIEDKRLPSNSVNPNKVLYLDGTCIFGGVEIKSY